MIANDREYRITKREMRKFEAAIASLVNHGIDGETDDELFRRLQVSAMRSQLADLADEIAEFDAERGQPHGVSSHQHSKAVG